MYDKLVAYVFHILELQKQLSLTSTPHENVTIHRSIDATDIQIDRLVFELYDLDEQEIERLKRSE